MSQTLTSSRLATSRSRPATSRTWLRLPAADPSAGLQTVWIESTMTTAGLRVAICSRIVSSEVSAARKRPGTLAPRRRPRSLTCARDSSPET